jgi:hypothetical protein
LERHAKATLSKLFVVITVDHTKGSALLFCSSVDGISLFVYESKVNDLSGSDEDREDRTIKITSRRDAPTEKSNIRTHLITSNNESLSERKQ